MSGGDIIGMVNEGVSFNHRILVPPNEKGTVRYIASEGNYTLEDVVLELEFEGKVKKLTMMHEWPVRQMRPVKEKLAADSPLMTGQRVLDTLFPCAQGGICAVHSAFGTGQMILMQLLIKNTNSDSIVYVG